MRVSITDSIDTVLAVDWNRVVATRYPFIRHEFLLALEQTACVNEQAGWLPQHCLVYDDDKLVAVMPMYRKMHSHGEYVFDYAWASAYHRLGLRYYPKWLTAIPFTPCEGPRLCVQHGIDRYAVWRLLSEIIAERGERYGVSTWHCLFHTPQEARLFATQLVIRQSVQFRWYNQGYRDFQDFLATFRAKKRKNLLQERRQVHKQGIVLQVLTGRDITEHTLATFFEFYQLTYIKYVNPPYLNFAFFKKVVETMPNQVVLIMAWKADRAVGATFGFTGDDSYYGRYWGCDEEYDKLHFEACYYQGIEYCIANRLRYFDPGAQGEHKIARGFRPTICYSAHYIFDPRLNAAIRNFSERESMLVKRYKDSALALLPFRRDDDGDNQKELAT